MFARAVLATAAAISITAVAAIASACNDGAGPDETFSRATYSDWNTWPRVADGAMLRRSCGVFLHVEPGGFTYALIDTAQTQLRERCTNARHYSEAKRRNDDGRLHQSLGQFVAADLEQCPPRDSFGASEIAEAIQSCGR